MNAFDSIPLWGFFVGTVIIVMVSIEGGYQLGRGSRRKSEDEKESPVSAIAGSILGLTAFMLAFVFGIVLNRFDARKEFVMREANAVRTAWLRADFLPAADRSETKNLIHDYLKARINFVLARDLSSTTLSRFASEVARVQERIWDTAVDNARKDMNSDVAALYIESLNEIFEIHASRTALVKMRVPAVIWLMLLVLTALGMVGLGYQTGISGSQRSRARPIMAMSFAMVISLIADLDQPAKGLISVSQQPLIDCSSWISESAAGEQTH